MEPHDEVLTMLHGIVDVLCEIPPQVVAEVTKESITFRVTPHPSQVGRLIGKSGRIARSIRLLLGAASMRYGIRFSLNIEQAQP